MLSKFLLRATTTQRAAATRTFFNLNKKNIQVLSGYKRYNNTLMRMFSTEQTPKEIEINTAEEDH